MKLMSDKVIENLNGIKQDVPESFSSSDIAVLKTSSFIEGVNHFDCYHFAMPKTDIQSFFTDKKELYLPKNTILATNPGQKLKVSPVRAKHNQTKDTKFICMFIEPQKLQQLAETEFNKTELLFRNNISHLSNNISSLVTKLEIECRNKQFGYQFIVDCLFLEIAVGVMRELQSNMPGMHEFRKYSARKEINLAIDYLWENVNIDFSLENLCKIAKLSPYYFVRLFKDNTGKTPYEYYMDIKIRKATEYLKSGKYSITEICFILGFSSHSHFSSVFKKRVGITPSEFIKRIT